VLSRFLEDFEDLREGGGACRDFLFVVLVGSAASEEVSSPSPPPKDNLYYYGEREREWLHIKLS
jgi:hypothetical protein